MPSGALAPVVLGSWILNPQGLRPHHEALFVAGAGVVGGELHEECLVRVLRLRSLWRPWRQLDRLAVATAVRLQRPLGRYNHVLQRLSWRQLNRRPAEIQQLRLLSALRQGLPRTNYLTQLKRLAARRSPTPRIQSGQRPCLITGPGSTGRAGPVTRNVLKLRLRPIGRLKLPERQPSLQRL